MDLGRLTYLDEDQPEELGFLPSAAGSALMPPSVRKP